MYICMKESRQSSCKRIDEALRGSSIERTDISGREEPGLAVERAFPPIVVFLVRDGDDFPAFEAQFAVFLRIEIEHRLHETRATRRVCVHVLQEDRVRAGDRRRAGDTREMKREESEYRW